MTKRLLAIRIAAILLATAMLCASAWAEHLKPRLAAYRQAYLVYQARTCVVIPCRNSYERRIVDTARFLGWQTASREYGRLTRFEKFFVAGVPEHFVDPRSRASDTLRNLTDDQVMLEFWRIVVHPSPPGHWVLV